MRPKIQQQQGSSCSWLTCYKPVASVLLGLLLGSGMPHSLSQSVGTTLFRRLTNLSNGHFVSHSESIHMLTVVDCKKSLKLLQNSVSIYSNTIYIYNTTVQPVDSALPRIKTSIKIKQIQLKPPSLICHKK